MIQLVHMALTTEEIIGPVRDEINLSRKAVQDAREALNDLHYKELGVAYVKACEDDPVKLQAAIDLLTAYLDAVVAALPPV